MDVASVEAERCCVAAGTETHKTTKTTILLLSIKRKGTLRQCVAPTVHLIDSELDLIARNSDISKPNRISAAKYLSNGTWRMNCDLMSLSK